MLQPEHKDGIDAGIDAVRITWAGLLALVGGVVQELAHGKQYSVIKMLIGAIIGAFAGIIAFCVCSHFFMEDSLTAAVTGMAGYMGAPLLDTISRYLKKVIKNKTEETES